MLKASVTDTEELQAAKLSLARADAARRTAGVDFDWYVSKHLAVAKRRENAAKSGYPDLDGRLVTISGFAIPAPPGANGVEMAYRQFSIVRNRLTRAKAMTLQPLGAGSCEAG